MQKPPILGIYFLSSTADIIYMPNIKIILTPTLALSQQMN